jgi:hypothetical protein
MEAALRRRKDVEGPNHLYPVGQTPGKRKRPTTPRFEELAADGTRSRAAATY